MAVNDFSIPKKVAKDYERNITEVVRRMLPPKGDEQSFESWIANLSAVSQRRDVEEATEFLAKRMVSWVNVRNERTWRAAANKSQRGRALYRLLQGELTGTPTGSRFSRLVRENARLIGSIPLEAATVLNREIAKAAQSGARPATIAKMARTRFPQLLRSRVNLIARTETQKTSTALTRARSEQVGVDWYIWETSQDGDRVRESHRKMQGVVVPWSQAPDPERLVGEKSTLGHYHVGECPNCRCTPIVVLTLDDINFPARVYWNGSIQRMTKTKFKQLTNIEERQAA